MDKWTRLEYRPQNDPSEIVHISQVCKYNKQSINMGLVRWAMGEKTSDFKSVMLIKNPDVNITYDHDAIDSRGNHIGAILKKGGFLSGAVSFFENIYVINFYPQSDFIEWKLANEEDIGLVFGLTREVWNNNRNDRNDRYTDPCPSGYIQSAFVARLLEHIIRIGDHWKNDIVKQFFKNYRLMKRQNIKKIPINNLTHETKNEIMFFIVSLAIIDPSTVWKTHRDKTSAHAEIILIGRPHTTLFSNPRRLDFKFPVEI